jgi:hypothetical protein
MTEKAALIYSCFVLRHFARVNLWLNEFVHTPTDQGAGDEASCAT